MMIGVKTVDNIITAHISVMLECAEKLLLIIRRDGYNMPVNILLADDHRMVREGLKQLLGNG